MSDSEISIAAISSKKVEDSLQGAQVAVIKKALDQHADISRQLIESATPAPLPEGVGRKVNTIA